MIAALIMWNERRTNVGEPQPGVPLEDIAMIIDRALYRHPAEMFPPSDERANRPFDYARMARILAAVDAARFLEENFASACNLIGKEELLRGACQVAHVDGIVAEFGVMEGRTLRILCEEFPDTIVHGFDSFQGIPEDWTHDKPAGTFSTEGRLPLGLPGNSRLHVGMFEDTATAFRESCNTPISLLHIDSDVYSSARSVLSAIGDLLIPGSIIVFDEFINYPGWRQHEYKAWMEYSQQAEIGFRYIAFSSSYLSVAIEINARAGSRPAWPVQEGSYADQ